MSGSRNPFNSNNTTYDPTRVLTPDERSVEPLDVVAVGIVDKDLVAGDGERQQQDRAETDTHRTGA